MGAGFKRLRSGDIIEPFVSPNGKYVPPDEIGQSVPVFAGTLCFNNPIGTIWPDYVQTGALAIGVDQDAMPGGTDSIRITANGSAITLDATFTWVNIGSDSIGTTAADVNELIFFVKRLTTNSAGVITGGTILYTCKLNP